MLNFKWKQLEAAVDFFRYNIPTKDDATVQVTVREENFENNVIGSCLSLTVTYKKQPEQYDRWEGEKTITHTLEVFSHGESMHPRLTTQETQELIPKKRS